MKNTTNINKKKGLSQFIIGCMIFIGIAGVFSGCSDSTAKTNSTNNSSNAVTTTSTKPSTSNTTSNNSTSVTTNDNKPSDNGQSTTNNTSTNTSDNITGTNTNNPPVQPRTDTTSVSSEDSTIVYYVPGSNVYHLSESDGTLKRSKNIQSMTLKEAKAQGMHQSQSKADQ